MVKPGNREESSLGLNRRMELFQSDVWGAMDQHGVTGTNAAYILSQIIQDLLWEQVNDAVRHGE